jgi:hypothetical protein
MHTEVKNSLIKFCNKNGIQWMPINLKIKDGKKDLEPISHSLYNGRPKMTDFKEKPEIIKQRQDLIIDGKDNKLFNFIAMDTSRVFHIDIDTSMKMDLIR